MEIGPVLYPPPVPVTALERVLLIPRLKLYRDEIYKNGHKRISRIPSKLGLEELENMLLRIFFFLFQGETTIQRSIASMKLSIVRTYLNLD